MSDNSEHERERRSVNDVLNEWLEAVNIFCKQRKPNYVNFAEAVEMAGYGVGSHNDRFYHQSGQIEAQIQFGRDLLETEPDTERERDELGALLLNVDSVRSTVSRQSDSLMDECVEQELLQSAEAETLKTSIAARTERLHRRLGGFKRYGPLP